MAPPSLSYEFKDELADKKISLSPVFNTHAGLSITKDKYSLGTSFEDPAKNENIEKYGRTKFFDIQLSTIYHNYFIDLYYQKYQGFRLESELTKTSIDYNYESLNYGLQVFKFTNSSYKAKYNLNHYAYKRMQQASNFFAMDISRNKLSNKNNLIPKDHEVIFDEYIKVTEVYQRNLSLIFGRSQQSIFFEKWYVQTTIGLGFNYSETTYNGGSISKTSKTSSKYLINLDSGYQFKQSLLGFQLLVNANELRADTSTITYSRFNSSIYYNFFF